MFCSKCGTKLDDNAKFCGGCGSPTGVGAPSAPAAPRQAAPQPMPVPPPPMTPPPAPSNGAVIPPPPVFQAAPPQPAPVPPPASANGTIVPPPAAQPAPNGQPYPPAQTYPQQPGYPPPGTAQPGYAPMGQPAPLNFTVFGANLPAVSIKLNPGESIFTQSGGMVWMDGGINMTTNMQGGFMKGLGRMISGDSLFMATYTSTMPNQELCVASTFPGSIVSIELKGNAIIAQKSAFLCAQPTVSLSAYVTRSIGAGLFGGEGFIMQRLTGFGRVFLEVDGSMVERTLAPGQVLKVDTGNVAAFEESVGYQAEMVKGFKNILFGGEGLFLTTLTGPGKVWLQTMTMPTFAKQLIPFLPKSTSN